MAEIFERLKEFAERHNSKAVNISSRYILVYVALFAVFGVMGLRLFQLQIVDHDKYVVKANAERTKQTVIEAKRGQIYMMSGDDDVEAVVMNERVWRVFVDPYYIVKNYSKYKEVIGDLIDDALGDSKTYQGKWSTIWQSGENKNMYTVLAKEVDYKTARALRDARIVTGKDANGRDITIKIPGYGLQETTRRVYPSKSLAAQILGYEFECPVKDENGKLQSRTCRAGVEKAFDAQLTGVDGKVNATYDINNVQLSIGSEYVETPAKDGQNILLSMDINIQRKVENVLQETVDNKASVTAASVVVMNPQNGKIMAMANYPTFDLNNRNKIPENAADNRVTTLPYEPASTCKPFVYATALDKGAITPQMTYTNTGSTKVDDRTIYNANRSMQHTGEITFATALDYSLNTGSVEVLRRIGGGTITKSARETYYDYLYNKFGLGQKTGIEIDEEIGTLYSPSHQEGNAVRYSNMTFGQGMSATMIQMAAGFSSLVNGGNYYKPTLYGGVVDSNGKITPAESNEALRTTVSANTSATMRKMLKEVRSINGGANDPKGYNIGIKTGTAETVNEKGQYTSDKTDASVLGFGGADGEDEIPQYVIMVRLDGNSLLWGSVDAVPVFTQISNYLIDYLRIEPSL